MEESRFRIFWKKNYKLVFLFFIRLTEVFASSIVPSILGVMLIFMNPDKKIWTIINFITLIGFAFINFRFLLKYIAGRNNRKEFYILNGIVYLIYVGASIAAFKWTGYLVYSMVFANLRGLEAFGMKTFHSVLACDGITLVSIVILGQYAYSHMDFVRRLVRMNGADAVEIFYDEAAPMQHSHEIETLSVEEMDREIENEIKEAAELIRRQQEELPDGDENEKAVKGNNEEIEFTTPADPEDDIDETDYVEANAERINKNGAYDSGALWEKDIYGGGEPIMDYDDEYELDPAPEHMPSAGDRIKGVLRHHIRSVTRTAVVKIKNRIDEAGFEADELEARNAAHTAADHNEAYASGSLWETRMYQGQSESNIPEYSEDFDNNIEARAETGLEDYDGDNLWSKISRGRVLDDAEAIAEEEEMTETGLEDYDSDSLWNVNVYQGRRK